MKKIYVNKEILKEAVDYLNNEIGKERISKLTANIAFAGFTLPKLLWVKENEPENYGNIRKVMLPKDYVAYMLSGTFCTDVSDASGMQLLDVKMTRETLVKIERGVQHIQLEQLKGIKQILNVTYEDLLD